MDKRVELHPIFDRCALYYDHYLHECGSLGDQLLPARNERGQADIEDVTPLDSQIAHSIRSPLQIALRSSSSSSLLGQLGSRPRRRRLLCQPW